MHTERLGRYEVELSARQMIHNGGWAGFAAIHTVADAAREGVETAQPTVQSTQWVADETAVFASEAAAIAGARAAALAFLRSGDPPREV